ncbi:hypothetical protein BU17DRAFT_80014 [Hysterangium stoloniferum]|nr:hypothetical protein BU17DRAFT_80014 [Hysterangium stoloniferum]
MAKSLRSKTKRVYRRVKRESGVFAVADAARLQRLSAKLRAKINTDKDGDLSLLEGAEEMVEQGETEEGVVTTSTDVISVDKGMEAEQSAPKEEKISTSGRRLSRREAWRIAKGKAPQNKNPERLNRSGGVVAKRKSGRPGRRR